MVKKSKIKEKKVLILNSNKFREKMKWNNKFNIKETLFQTCMWYKIFLTGNKKKIKKYSLNLINKSIS